MRYLAAIIVAVALVALATRAPATRRVLLVVLAVIVLYAVMKLTGIVDALAPDRMGVF
jgi:hypothetical protein